ncbi:MAG: TGS domain-containing protein, partial [Candidatus Caldarchaeum sp.]
SRDWTRISRAAEAKQVSLTEEIAKKLSGLGVSEDHVTEAISTARLDKSRPTGWSPADLRALASKIRSMTKPVIVAANKTDIPGSEQNVEKIRMKGYEVVAISAEAERTLRLAAAKQLVKYMPGDSSFTVTDESKLTPAQRKALEYIRENVFKKWNGTGVQTLINKAYLEKLGYIPVYPVENPHTLTDHEGNVLPDVYLMPRNSTARDLAFKIHSELGEGFLYAVDALTGMRFAENQPLKPNDVVSIVSAKKRG